MKYKISLLLLLLLLLPSCFIRLVNPPPEPTAPAVKGKSGRPPLPTIMIPFADPVQQMIATPQIVRELTHDFDIIDQRLTNGLGEVTLAWNPNTESDLAGYELFQGPASNSYTSKITLDKSVNTYTVQNLPRTSQTHFALAAFSTAGLRSALSTNRPFWPNQTAPAYSNVLVTVPYLLSTNVNGPWMSNAAQLHYLSLPPGTTLFWKGLPLSIEKVP